MLYAEICGSVKKGNLIHIYKNIRSIRKFFCVTLFYVNFLKIQTCSLAQLFEEVKIVIVFTLMLNGKTMGTLQVTEKGCQ